MKKILLIIIILLTTGCYDYIELNNLSIVSAIGIDYQNNEFIITLEILNNQNNIENGITSYDVSIKGSSITEAFNSASLVLNKAPYYYHLKTIIISEDIAKNHLKKIMDYFIRNPKIIHSFYLVMCKDITSKDFLNIKNTNHLIIGNEIESKMNNLAYHDYFEDVLERLTNNKKDAILNTFIIKDNNIEYDGLALFKDYHLVDLLDTNLSSYLNLLLNNKPSVILENNYLIIDIYESNTSYKIDNNKIIINTSCEAQIVENKKNNKLKKDESYLKFNQDFSLMLNNDLSYLINTLKESDIDPIGIKWMIYQKYKKDITIKEIIINTNVIVNKKGLIFEVNYE